ncbi:MAG: hypothetical protein IJ728_03335 [Selenomonadaceae bacterium]|nr:hypothetical protein [Selenomonadaceae bacterium]
MFKTEEIQRIIKICPSDFEELLKNLQITMPNFDQDDENKSYEILDESIEKNICGLLNSNSLSDGYEKLLSRGGISFVSNDTRNEMIKKIVSSREKILQGVSISNDQNSDEGNSDSILSRLIIYTVIVTIFEFALSFVIDNLNLPASIAGLALGFLIAELIRKKMRSKKSPASEKNSLTQKQIEKALKILTLIDNIFEKIKL